MKILVVNADKHNVISPTVK